MCCKVHVLQSASVAVHDVLQSAPVAKWAGCLVHILQSAKSMVTSNPYYIFLSYILHLIHYILHIASDTLQKSLKP